MRKSEYEETVGSPVNAKNRMANTTPECNAAK